jgi:hypothetical protein
MPRILQNLLLAVLVALCACASPSTAAATPMFHDIFTVDCNGGVHAFSSHQFMRQGINLQHFKRVYEYFVSYAKSNAKCHCDALTEEQLDGRSRTPDSSHAHRNPFFPPLISKRLGIRVGSDTSAQHFSCRSRLSLQQCTQLTRKSRSLLSSSSSPSRRCVDGRRATQGVDDAAQLIRALCSSFILSFIHSLSSFSSLSGAAGFSPTVGMLLKALTTPQASDADNLFTTDCGGDKAFTWSFLQMVPDNVVELPGECARVFAFFLLRFSLSLPPIHTCSHTLTTHSLYTHSHLHTHANNTLTVHTLTLAHTR